MSYRIDQDLKKELNEFGLHSWNECFHCGNCTAICPLSSDDNLFPRRSIRVMQMGLKDKLASSVDPWLCYYCGECSETCPRDANPGEVLMILRRYLTSLYDWTGLSKKFYTSKTWELGAIFFIAAIVIGLFAFLSPPGNIPLTDEGGVMINTFAPIIWVELGDWAMGAFVAILLISNILRMFYMVILKDKSLKVPFITYITEFWSLAFHFGSQWKFSKCDDKKYWLYHWLLMTGYTLMFIMVVVFLPWFQTEEIHPVYHPQRLLGYYATFGLLVGLTAVFIGRFRKKEEKFKYTHISDWLFIIMLMLTVITGILVHIFRIYGYPLTTYYLYVAHLAILVPMIMIEVPFSKWSHLAYRPFGIYFARVKSSARARQQEKKVVLAAT